MDIFAPDYYNEFKCIGSKCLHNCCIGWEIDIDEDTVDFYKTQPDIIKHIELCDTPHFKLQKNNRCPFLNDENLCEIIINHSESALCQICSYHPRFYNFYDTRTEAGLGLTCEAAARLILTRPIKTVKIGSDCYEGENNPFEEEFFIQREEIFNTSYKTFADLLPEVSINKAAEFFGTLERLDDDWERRLSTLASKFESIKESEIKNENIAQNLFNYFVFRYFDNLPLEFCIFCTYFILSFPGDVFDNARAFSAEIEYSDQNTDAIMDYLENIKNRVD